MVDATSDNFEPPMRFISILVAVIVAAVLSYAYHAVLPSFPMVTTVPLEEMLQTNMVYSQMNVASLIVFVTIPVLAGFLAGLIYPEKAISDGLYVGLFGGVINSIVGAFKMLFKQSLTWPEIYAFGFFIIISVFAWMVIAAIGASLGKELYR